MSVKGMNGAMFMVWELQEKFLAKKEALFYAFLDLEKAFKRLPREVSWWSLKNLGVEEWLVNGIMIMYDNARTPLKT